MRDDSLSAARELPAALSAFLRGAERRAFVFLWLQGGDAATAERALAAAIRAFPGPAAAMPMAEWPVRFWKLLVALPAQAEGGHWPAGLEGLATMRLPVRRALLLRQVAGLDEAEAAAILDIESSAHQVLLAEACPRDPGGVPDVAGWRVQAEAIQQAGRALDTPQLLRLAQLREAALQARPVLPATQARHVSARPAAEKRHGQQGRPARAGGWKRLLALLATMLVLGAIAAAWWQWSRPAPVAETAVEEPPQEEEDFLVHDNDPVVAEPLAQTGSPAPVAGAPRPMAAAAPADRVIADLALLSWYAAGAPPSRMQREDARADSMPAAAAVADAAGDLAEWSQLGEFEQAGLRAAAAALANEDPQAQAALRARFAALDAMERRGWRLGPTLGADYASLQPLVGFVAEEERAPLLDALRALTPEQRAELAGLAKRTPPPARAELRRELLAQPPEQRGTWLAERVRE